MPQPWLLQKIPDAMLGLWVRSPSRPLSSSKARSCKRLSVLQRAGFACVTVTYVTVSGGCRRPSRAVPTCTILPTVGFGSRMVSGANFAQLPSTSCLQLCTHNHPSIPQHNPTSSPHFISSFPFQPHRLRKKPLTPKQSRPHFPGYSVKAGVFPFFVCVRTCVCVSLDSSLTLMGPWSLFYTKATQVDVFLNGLILSPCLMICRVIY